MAGDLYERLGSEFLVNTTTLGGQADPTITWLASGGFVVSWTDSSGQGGDADGGIKAQIFDAAGAMVGAEFLVNTTTGGGQHEATITSLASGGFVVSWTINTFGVGIRAQIFNAVGAKVGGELLVNTSFSVQSEPTITSLASGGFVVSWQNPTGDASGYDIKAQVFSAAGAKVGAEFLVNTVTLNDQLSPAITSLASGGFVVSWTGGSDVKAQIFNAAGVKVGAEFLVNTATLFFQSGPTITSLASGGFVVSWTDYLGDVVNFSSSAGIKAQIFDAAGAKVGGEFLVNTQMSGDQLYPTITSLSSGGFVVTWIDNSGEGGDVDGGIKAQIFNAAGAKVGGEFLVNTATLSAQVNPTITSTTSGGFVVSWYDHSGQGGDDSGTSIKAQIFRPYDGTIDDIAISSSSISETAIGNLSVATLSANGANISFTYELIDDSSGGAFRVAGNKLIIADNEKLDFETAAQVSITVRARDDVGNFFDKIISLDITNVVDEIRYSASGEFLVNTETASGQVEPTVTNLANGGFVVSWWDGSGTLGDSSGASVKAQIFDAAGVKVGTEFLVNTQIASSQQTPTIAGLANGGFVVSWGDFSGTLGDASGQSIKAQVFDAVGARVGTEFLVNTQTAGNQEYPAITGLANGGFVVSWHDISPLGDSSGYSVKAQLFDSTGAKVGTEFLVNTQTANGQAYPTITGLANGGFVVSWTDSSGTLGDSDGTSVKAQVFDSVGTKVGTEFLVNTETANNELEQTITALANGGFVISWYDWLFTTGDGFDNISAQVFDASGAKVGTEFLVNTGNYDTAPTITGLSTGGFVVSWRDLFGNNIHAQVFDAVGTKFGTEFVVNTETFSFQTQPTITGLPNGGFVVSWQDSSGTLGDASETSIKAQIFSLVDPNDPPVTTDDALSATEDQSATYAAAALVGNDSDADGDTLVVASVANAINGSVLLNPDGSVTFTPDADFFGEASFDYVVSDGNGGSDTGAVLVTVANVNDEPTGFPIISGTAAEGQLLTASNDIADADGMGAISYQWERDGFDIAGETGVTYLLTQADVGTEIRLGARYTDGGGTVELRGSAATALVTNVNDAPTGAVTISGTAAEDQLLTASNDLADEDGLGAIGYQWQRGGVDVAGATGATYLLGHADVGAAISVVASYTDGQGTAESVASAATAAVINVNDAPTGAVTISGTAAEDQLLTASNDLADEDGLGTIGYQWQRGGVDVAGATGATYLLGQADVGTAISVIASYTDGQGTAESVTSAATAAVTNVNDAPTGAVTISGTAAEDQLLTASNTLADEDGLGAIGYQWQRGGIDIVGATGASYLIGQADVGTAISVVASYTDGQGTAESVISAATAAVTNVNDAPTGVVTISGTAAEGQLLTAANTLADEDGLGAIGYQWQRGGVDIAGATGATYLLGQADVGAGISVVASYTDGGGTLESVASGATAAVTGVSATQTYTGTAANDFFAAPNDANWVVNGLGGNDTLITQGGRDVVSGGTGNDIIATGDNDDIVVFTGANGGFDSVAGGAGNDRIEARAAGTIIGLTALAGIEMITANGFLGVSILGSSAANSFDFSAVTLDGIQRIDLGSGNDTLVGSQAADTILGGAGNDTLNGSGGDDIFRVDTGAGTDRFTGGDGFDQIVAIRNNVTIGIGLLNGIEAISAGGFTNVRIAGTSGADLLDFSLVNLTNIVRIDGGNGNDTITGSIAADTILGGDGNDSLNGLNGNDLLQGGAGNDHLQGSDGSDTLQGDGGDDTLNGGAEADRLVGGSGQDALTGGLGNDVFAYLNTNDSRSSNNRDTILDFAQGNDLIDLAAIDANRLTAANDAFSFIGENAFTGVAGQLRYQNIGGNTVLQGDVNGDGLSDLYIQIVGSLELQATDFLF